MDKLIGKRVQVRLPAHNMSGPVWVNGKAVAEDKDFVSVRLDIGENSHPEDVIAERKDVRLEPTPSS